MRTCNTLLWCLVTIVLLGCGGNGSGEDWAEPAPSADMSLAFQHTDSLAVAREILAQGRQPILDATALLLEPGHKRLRADAAARLARAQAEYPDVMHLGGLMVEVIDEVFLRYDGSVSSPAQQTEDLLNATEAIQLLRSRLPAARLGVVVAPEAWLDDAAVVAHFNKLLLQLDWAATDPYFWTTHIGDANTKLRAAREFADHVAQVAPAVQRWIVIQGFAPMDLGPDPARWTPAGTLTFVDLLRQLFGIAAAQYHGTVIWGWNLPDGSHLTPYRVFPNGLKRVYREGLALQCLTGASDGIISVGTVSAAACSSTLGDIQVIEPG